MKLRKVVALVVAVTLGSFLLFEGSLNVWCWQARREAGLMLETAKQFHPGVTSQAEVERSLAAFARFRRATELKEWGWTPQEQSNEYMVTNFPNWYIKFGSKVPFQSAIYLHPWTGFSVTPQFTNGVLSSLHVVEFQTPPKEAFFHIFHVGTREFSTKYPADTDLDQREHGRPYEVRPDIMGATIYLDERASEQQRLGALDYDFHCMTSLVMCTKLTQLVSAAKTFDPELLR